MANLISRVAFVVLLALAGQASALQVIDATLDGKTHSVRFSKTEITRVAIEGGRIASLHFPDGALIVEKNEEQGFVILRAKTDKQVGLFITSENGKTHALQLTPADIPMETLLIKEGESKATKEERLQNSLVGKTEPVAQSVKRLVLMMARNEREARDYEIKPINQHVDLWQESQFYLVEQYKGIAISGYRFALKNISEKVMRLGEQEFWKRGVIAVAIDNHVLSPGEETQILIITVSQDV